jgi:hypothetical protein
MEVACRRVEGTLFYLLWGSALSIRAAYRFRCPAPGILMSMLTMLDFYTAEPLDEVRRR